MPSDRAQYIHRLGRTARAGKSGAGVLLLADFEKRFLNELQDLPLTMVDVSSPSAAAADALAKALRKMNPITIATAYQAWLGYYNGALKRIGWSKEQLVANANDMVLGAWKASEVPGLEPKTVGKMGLKGVAGLIVRRGAAGSAGLGGGRAPAGRGGGSRGAGAARAGGRDGGGGAARTAWVDARSSSLRDSKDGSGGGGGGGGGGGRGRSERDGDGWRVNRSPPRRAGAEGGVERGRRGRGGRGGGRGAYRAASQEGAGGW